MSQVISGQNIYTGQSIFSKEYLLDNISNIQFAYGMTKLTASATYCGKIRRSSDDSEQDFGFNPENNLVDINAITTFLDGFTGYWTRIYNQGAYGGYAQQTNTAKQPEYAVDEISGLPYIKLANNRYLGQLIADPATLFVNNFYFFSAIKINGFSTSEDIFITLNEKGRIVPTATGIDFSYHNTLGERIICKASGGWTQDRAAASAPLVINTPYVLTGSRNDLAMYVCRDGVLTGSDLVISAGPIEWPIEVYFNIGIGATGPNQRHFCTICSNANLSAIDKLAIEQYMINQFT